MKLPLCVCGEHCVSLFRGRGVSDRVLAARANVVLIRWVWNWTCLITRPVGEGGRVGWFLPPGPLTGVLVGPWAVRGLLTVYTSFHGWIQTPLPLAPEYRSQALRGGPYCLYKFMWSLFSLAFKKRKCIFLPSTFAQSRTAGALCKSTREEKALWTGEM